eukprot:3733025-Prymnesium_polylepis.1
MRVEGSSRCAVITAAGSSPYSRTPRRRSACAQTAGGASRDRRATTRACQIWNRGMGGLVGPQRSGGSGGRTPPGRRLLGRPSLEKAEEGAGASAAGC